jgi:hypothetical protein
MKKRTSHRTSASPERSRHIEKRCLAYALAAGGTALVTAPAKAEIVYTPTHKVVDTPGSLMVDLNNDGISDIKLDDFSVFGSSSGQIKQLGVRGVQNPSARVIGKKAGFPFQMVSSFLHRTVFRLGRTRQRASLARYVLRAARPWLEGDFSPVP